MQITNRMEGVRGKYQSISANLDRAKREALIIKKIAGAKNALGFSTIISKITNMQVIKTTFGVSNLKKAITYLGGQIRNAYSIDQDGDGKSSTAELIQYGLATIATLPGILPAFSASEDEIKDLTSAEINELVDHVLNTEFLPDDRERAEHYVKSLIYVLNVNRQMVSFSIKFFAGEDVRFDPLAGLL